MTFTGAPNQTKLLRKLITEDLRGETGTTRSSTAILQSLLAYLKSQKREKELGQVNFENESRYIRDFAKGAKDWKSGLETKSLIWEMYDSEKRINPPVEDFSKQPCLFFSSQHASIKSPKNLIGKYVIYKKAINSTEERIVRGFIQINTDHQFPDLLVVHEIHIDRSSKAQKIEFWTGAIAPRERGYCMITKESKKGTPKMAVLEAVDTDGNLVKSMRGYSVECVENWGSVNIFRSGIYLERVSEDTEYENNAMFDLVSVNSLKKESKFIWSYL